MGECNCPKLIKKHHPNKKSINLEVDSYELTQCQNRVPCGTGVPQPVRKEEERRHHKNKTQQTITHLKTM